MSEIEMLKSWCARARAIEKEHFRACVRFRKMHYLWGGLLISLSALASALTGVAESGGDVTWLTVGIWRFFRILLAIFVPVLAALVTFLSYESRSTNHHHAAARFAALKRQLSIAIVHTEAGEGSQSAQKTLEDVCEQWNELTENMPALYKKKWEKQIARYEAELGLRSSSQPSSNSPAA